MVMAPAEPFCMSAMQLFALKQKKRKKKTWCWNDSIWNDTIQHGNLAAGHATHLELWMCSTRKLWRAGSEVPPWPGADPLLEMRVSPKLELEREKKHDVPWPHQLFPAGCALRLNYPRHSGAAASNPGGRT